MFSDDEDAADVNGLDAEVAMLLRDFELMTRRAGLRPRNLKRRLREIGVSEREIVLCQTRSNLLELLLFAKIPSEYPALRPRAEIAHTRAPWAVLIGAIAGLLLAYAEGIFFITSD